MWPAIPGPQGQPPRTPGHGELYPAAVQAQGRRGQRPGPLTRSRHRLSLEPQPELGDWPQRVRAPQPRRAWPAGRTPRTQGAVGRRRGSAKAGRVSSTPERAAKAPVKPRLTRVCLEIWRDKCAFHCRPKKIHCPVHYNGTGTCSLDAVNLIEGGECAKYAFPFVSSRASSPDIL